jgi:hypothetical protein
MRVQRNFVGGGGGLDFLVGEIIQESKIFASIGGQNM